MRGNSVKSDRLKVPRRPTKNFFKSAIFQYRVKLILEPKFFFF
jgi:hypothetical protein